METLQFKKELYPKIVLFKAAYHFTDMYYLHLDADDSYYYVRLSPKDGTEDMSYQEFENEMLTQSVRHEVYLRTKNIRELILARAFATTVLTERDITIESSDDSAVHQFQEEDILKNWFSDNEHSGT